MQYWPLPTNTGMLFRRVRFAIPALPLRVFAARLGIVIHALRWYREASQAERRGG
jgi:hypothetical protein